MSFNIPLASVKISRPTINLSINKNVQNVMITPMNYPSSQIPQTQTNAASRGASGLNPQGAGAGSGGGLSAAAQKKRTSSEDNVNVQQAQQQRAMMAAT